VQDYGVGGMERCDNDFMVKGPLLDGSTIGGETKKLHGRKP